VPKLYSSVHASLVIIYLLDIIMKIMQQVCQEFISI
jgi:hypothetical protein